MKFGPTSFAVPDGEARFGQPSPAFSQVSFSRRTGIKRPRQFLASVTVRVLHIDDELRVAVNNVKLNFHERTIQRFEGSPYGGSRSQRLTRPLSFAMAE